MTFRWFIQVNSSFWPLLLTLASLPAAARADWQSEIGLTRLQTLNGGELPTQVSTGLTQVEAPESANYSPDTASSLFSGKTFTAKSGTTGVSSHATGVAANFYGFSGVLPGSSHVDLYEANDWLLSGFLKTGSSGQVPLVETRAVQNHSWISTASSSSNTEINARLDYAIHRDGFVCVVGVNNGASASLPTLLCQAYNTLSVGLTHGGHSAGLTTLTTAGRMKPEIVAPDTYTSFATPMVAGTAGMLYAKLKSDHSLAGADLPRTVKALLMAGARKDTVASWSNSGTSPLDAVYGAGELNAYHAYSILRSGRAAASSSVSYPIRGWAAESVGGNASKTYHFTIPAGAASTPFCSALTWHRTVNNIFTWNTSLNHLNLTLYQANGFSLGSQIATSASTVDNVQLIYQPALAPGDYALVVNSTSATSTPYALAWHSLPTVSVAATVPTASESTGAAGVFTLTRTGDTTLPLYVPLVVGGGAVPGSHYAALPASVILPANAASVTVFVTPIPDDLPQGDRLITLAVADDFALVHPTAAAEVTLLDKPMDSWKFAHFTTEELADDLISGNHADPDGDGIPNLLEYAFGLLPKSADIPPVSQSMDGDYLTLSATKNSAATDLIWSAETSENLENWGAATVITDTADHFVARDTVAQSAAAKRFIRLRVTIEP